MPVASRALLVGQCRRHSRGLQHERRDVREGRAANAWDRNQPDHGRVRGHARGRHPGSHRCSRTRSLRLVRWRSNSFACRWTRAGRFEVEVGRAALPNGLLTEASLDISDPPFPGFQLGGVTMLEIRPVDPPGPPLWNRYVTGWRKGTVTVAAVVTLRSSHSSPGRCSSCATSSSDRAGMRRQGHRPLGGAERLRCAP